MCVATIGNLCIRMICEYIRQEAVAARRIIISEVMGSKLLIVALISVVWWQIVLAQNSKCDLKRKWCSKNDEIKCVDAKTIRCENLKYRKIDGSCNNPHNPAMGMAFTPFTRLLPSDYADGIYAMPVAASGVDLPSARRISYKVFGRKTITNPAFTHLNMQFGQVVTHDVSHRIPDGLDGLKPLQPKTHYCCTGYGRYVYRNDTTPCFPIPVTRKDPYFKNRDCIDFDRSITDKQQECKETADPVPAEQLNGVTQYMDLSLIYGNTDKEHARVRNFSGGLMLMTGNRKDQWPPRTDRPEYMCQLGNPCDTCYEIADSRANQNLGLVSLSIVFLREHNRLARGLATVNTHWDDETIFQEARRINIAQFQHIAYYEWSPNFYGYQRLLDCGLLYKTPRGKHVNDYDPCVDPRAIQSFFHSTFRYFHNQVKPFYELVTESRKTTKQKLGITEFLDKPGILEEQRQFNRFVRGMCTQNSALSDTNFDFEVAENFILGGGLRGRDLRSFDIQRGRDHGIPKYNQFRKFCGLKQAQSWDDYGDFISVDDINKLKKIYKSYEDVDLSVGTSLEEDEPDSLVGPTAMCISLIQFDGLRKGDRYFFESGDQPYPFTEDQLRQIRKTNIARILCDNTKINRMQRRAFEGISAKNPLDECKKLPRIHLRHWKDLK